MVELYVVAESVWPVGTVGTHGAGQFLLRPVGVEVALPVSSPLEGLGTSWTFVLNWVCFLSV